jgi:isovaleryl-CoA dehydrogenase
MSQHGRFRLDSPTEEHEIFRQTVAQFVRDEVEPQAEHYDEVAVLNRDLMQKCGALGLLGVTIPEEHGGAGLDTVASVIAHEELSKSDPGFCLAYLAHSVLFVHNLFHNANDEQRARYLPKTISGEWVGCMGMTEPSAGTDVLGMGTTATRDGDVYRLNGRKTFITNAPEAQVFLVYAKVEGRITQFVIERDFEGFDVSPKIPKMGMRASTMAELIMDDCVVPAENLLGEPGGGVRSMMRNLEIERLTLAAMSLGIAERCLEIMVQYSTERTAFGQPLHEFGQIQKHIAESYAKTKAARALIYDVAGRVAPGSRNRVESDACKLFAAPVGKEVADSAMQVLGGWGYCREFKVERFLRDAKLLEIGGGTLESHQKNITRDLTRARQIV